jgi:hypothetical protein
MRMRLPQLVFFALATALAAPPASAWGRPAHRVVANLAQARLRPGARAQVDRLLAGEPEPGLAGISAWADEVDKDGGQPGRHGKRWHYVDFRGGPTDCDYLPARDCPKGDCVVAAIDREFLRLADPRLADGERAQALKYLVHYVADVHQPFHATPVRDKGGLDFQVSWRGEGSNLHKAWDVLLPRYALERAGLDEAAYTRALQARPLPPDPARRSERPVVEWAQESCRLVRDGALYPASHLLGDEYLDAHCGQMEERLRLAGARLADMLNFALDPPEAR